MSEAPRRPGAAPSRREYLRSFLIRVTAVLVVFTTLAFTGMYLRTQQLLSESALAQARSYVDLIVTARDWNSLYGGVYVDKTLAGSANPYLLRLGVEPDVVTTGGRTLTLRNPALMTREISEMLAKKGGVTFRLTSLDPVNPGNSPDAWERTALRAFDDGHTEQWITTRSGATPVLRYLRPLVTETSCLTCHASQGYKVGDVRGAISVTVPLAEQGATLRDNALWLLALGLASTAVLLGLTYLLVRTMGVRLDEAQSALVRLATTDDLTGVWNRRHAIGRLREEIERSRRTGEPLSVVMVDVDLFKRVNDVFGHAAGDRTLAEVARRIEDGLRPYDLVGRAGGEEFLVLAPAADLDEGAALAERLREAVAARPVEYEDAAIKVTISAGVSVAVPGENDPLEQVLARADRAMYAAKAAGRDGVAVEAPGTPQSG